MTARIVGVDLSLTATGIAVVSGEEVIKTKAKGMERLQVISEAVVQHAIAMDFTDDPAGVPVDVHVFLEGYAFARPNQAHQLGELGGVVRYRLWDAGVPYTDVAPAALKKFATSKGNAKKPDMLDASRRAGYEGSNDDNCVDAWWLRQFGLYVFGAPAVAEFAYRDEVAKNVKVWQPAVAS